MTDGLDNEMFQRLVLANQYEILAGIQLEPDSAEHYRDLADRIRRWWPLETLETVGWMSESRQTPLTVEDQGFVMDVLELFDALQLAEGEGKVGKEDKSVVAFPGFCGNYEGLYLGYMEWLRDHDRFNYVRLRDPKDANSHMPMLAVYQRMVAKWEELGRPRPLSAADASAIIGERRRMRIDLNSRYEPEWTVDEPAPAPGGSGGRRSARRGTADPR